MYYYKKDYKIHEVKFNTIEEELNTLLSIAIQKPNTSIAIITTEDKIPYYANYIYNFLNPNKIYLHDTYESTRLKNNSSFFLTTGKIIYEEDYILNTKEDMYEINLSLRNNKNAAWLSNNNKIKIMDNLSKKDKKIYQSTLYF